MVRASSQRNRAACQLVCERRPVDQFQHQCRRAVRLLEPVNGGDVGVTEGGEQVRFAREPRQPVGITRERRRQHLQGDVAIQFGVARAVHLAHRARAERSHDFVGTDAKTRAEDGVRRRVVRRRRLGKWIGEDGLVDERQLIEEAGARCVSRQQRLDVATQRLVVSSRGGKKGVALVAQAVPRRPETAPSPAASGRPSRRALQRRGHG